MRSPSGLLLGPTAAYVVGLLRCHVVSLLLRRLCSDIPTLFRQIFAMSEHRQDSIKTGLFF